MRSVKILQLNKAPEPIRIRGKKVYSLYFGSGQRLDFTNLKTAQEYERNVLITINDFIKVSNIYCADLFIIYRRLWPALDQKTSGPINQVFIDLLGRYDNLFEINNTSMFNFIHKILEDLNYLIKTLDKKLKAKKMYLEIYNLQAIKNGLSAISLKVNAFKAQLK